jgi:hypothetical protein
MKSRKHRNQATGRLTAEARLIERVRQIARRVPVGNLVAVDSIVAELSEWATETEVLNALHKLQGQRPREVVYVGDRSSVRRIGVVKAGA